MDPLRINNVDYAAQVADLAQKLTAVGFPAIIFEPETHLRAGYFSRDIHKPLKVFGDCKDDAEVEVGASIGIRRSFFPSFSACTADAFYTFLRFLKTNEGYGEFGATLAFLRRLRKKTRLDFSHQDVCYHAMSELQKNDLAERTSDLRAKYGMKVMDMEDKLCVVKAKRPKNAMKVQDMEDQLCVLRAERDAALSGVKAKYLPMSEYVFPDAPTLNELCWAEYKAAADAVSRSVKPRDEKSLLETRNAFGDVVCQKHTLAFLEVGPHKQQLVEYVSKVVAGFIAKGKFREAGRLQVYLQGVGSLEVGQAPIPTSPTAEETDSDGSCSLMDQERAFKDDSPVAKEAHSPSRTRKRRRGLRNAGLSFLGPGRNLIKRNRLKGNPLRKK